MGELLVYQRVDLKKKNVGFEHSSSALQINRGFEEMSWLLHQFSRSARCRLAMTLLVYGVNLHYICDHKPMKPI